MNILFVTSDQRKARTVKAMVQREGPKVHTAFNQINVDELTEAIDFQWMVVDLEMLPKESGQKIFMKICENPHTMKSGRILMADREISQDEIGSQTYHHKISRDNPTEAILRIVSP